MGSLILCRRQHAKQPYEIVRVHKRIYSIEELCYFLNHNLYLIDYSLMNAHLVVWIKEELNMKTLAAELEHLLDVHASIEEFALTVLARSEIYTNTELAQMKYTLDQLKNLKEVERKKFKADSLLEKGELELASMIYQEIILQERDESLDETFYGQVYGCLGTAYGKNFMYQEAANMYEKAFMICEEESMLRAFLYACSCYMTPERYRFLLTKSEVYENLDRLIKAKITTTNDEADYIYNEQSVDGLKEAFRKTSLM